LVEALVIALVRSEACCPFHHRGKRAEGKGFEPSRPCGRTV
jgi:hypothetical protein